MNQNITIHWDFADGTEMPYGIAINTKDDFTTHCLDFFIVENIDAKVIRKDGKSIAVKDLLASNKQHTWKMITKNHNLHKMLVAGALLWD